MRTLPSILTFLTLTLTPPALTSRPRDEISFSCLPLTTELSDPIMFPGKTSDHAHIVVGGTAFQRTMAENAAKNAKGTTCGVDIDRSNYWIPQLYHWMGNGSFEIVEAVGIELYYMNRACNYTEDAEVCDKRQRHIPLAPPAGLRMIAGNPFLRTYNESDRAQQAISHMCIKEDGSSNETKHLPREPCSTMRSQVFFPSCWDGKNLDSKDHHSHMAYPAIGDYNQGVCPESHPVALISIFVEFLFNTKPFPDHKNLVYAMGDPTGYGLHGDFVNGWTDLDALHDALRTCTGKRRLSGRECSITKSQGTALVPQHKPLETHSANEDVGLNGPVAELPGGSHVTGPNWRKHPQKPIHDGGSDESGQSKPGKGPTNEGDPNPDKQPNPKSHQHGKPGEKPSYGKGHWSKSQEKPHPKPDGGKPSLGKPSTDELKGWWDFGDL